MNPTENRNTSQKSCDPKTGEAHADDTATQEPVGGATPASNPQDRLTPRLVSGLWYLDFPESRGGYLGSGN